MHGVWKEKVSGFDQKGTYRHKQTRKHTLRDKYRALLNTFSPYCNNRCKLVKSSIFFETEEGCIYIYGKPVEGHSKYYPNSRRLKYGKKLASSKDRTLLRNWLRAGNYDYAVKTHFLSKSLAWYIS